MVANPTYSLSYVQKYTYDTHSESILSLLDCILCWNVGMEHETGAWNWIIGLDCGTGLDWLNCYKSVFFSIGQILGVRFHSVH